MIKAKFLPLIKRVIVFGIKKNTIKSVVFNKNTQAILLISPLVIFLLIFSVYPIFQSFFNAFKVENNTNWRLGFSNFSSLFSKSAFRDALKNSTILFFLSSPIALFCGFVIAILLTKLKNKIVRSFLISGFYSQFFISAFAIGIAFSFLFGEKNVFSKILGLNFSFVGDQNRISLIWLYLIFQLWRAIPFNSVLFFFAFSTINAKYEKNFKIDKISLKDKIFNLYFKEISTQFMVIAYTNFVFATMLYPNVITANLNLDLNHGHTLASYILNVRDDLGLQAAASFVSFLYLLVIFSTFLIFRPKIWKIIYKKIKTKIKRKVENALKN
ncbi:carbohydrate ABC transporter permease [Mesomycoplasma hyopneumoniae]|uniref:carbohydrate ABC transporter permease n=1 Tax=Mesomycoplasma hyopneumoniae TaxID=2099 RepID=UPI001369BF41|nr:sugar ABC transporter permease [Mesomycoplasma hyopneumoniae]MXR64130.1 sugar ABC transporter permease [Mesomycoplasma hyopneumoniae]NYN92147.1 sugar ABC transporter permease [Mesomycoplasma hyopneumoniae]